MVIKIQNEKSSIEFENVQALGVNLLENETNIEISVVGKDVIDKIIDIKSIAGTNVSVLISSTELASGLLNSYRIYTDENGDNQLVRYNILLSQ